MADRVWVLRVASDVIAVYRDEASALAGLMAEPQAVLVPVTIAGADAEPVAGLHRYGVRFAPDGAVREISYGGPHDDDDPFEAWSGATRVEIETAAPTLAEVIGEARRYWQEGRE